MDSNLKREIILDNYQDPMNRGLIEDDSYIKVNTNSESCIDNLDLYIKHTPAIIIDNVLISGIKNLSINDLKQILTQFVEA